MEDAHNFCTVATEMEVSTTFHGIRQYFDPVAHGLDADFRLTKLLREPDDVLRNTLMNELSDQGGNSQDMDDAIKGHLKHTYLNRSITPLKHKDLILVQTSNYLYPLCEDPYITGRVTCANVLSTLYSMGVTQCDDILMLLTVSNTMKDKERNIILPLMIKGFKDCAREAGTSVSGSSPEINPWVTMGGVATSVCLSSEIISPDNSVPGDLLVLTKPLGTQIAITAHRWLDLPEAWNKLKTILSVEEVQKAYLRALDSMARLNKVASCLIHKYQAHAATRLSEFGLLGHAQLLAKFQKSEVSFVIHNMPIIAKMAAVAQRCRNVFPILEGYSEEISGGLLICLPCKHATKFLEEFREQECHESWIVGKVESGNRTARLIENPVIIEIPSTEKEGKLW